MKNTKSIPVSVQLLIDKKVNRICVLEFSALGQEFAGMVDEEKRAQIFSSPLTRLARLCLIPQAAIPLSPTL